MRISLQSGRLLGFQNDLDVSVNAAKVGNKPSSVGITILSASSSKALDAFSAADPAQMTYPVRIDR